MRTAPGFSALQSDRVSAAPGPGAAADPSTAAFRALALQVRAIGLLNRRPGYYRLKITLTILAFFAGWFLFVMGGDSWAALTVAPLLGMMFTQLGFIGHDAGHNQVFGTRRRNRLLGFAVGNVLTGLSFGWWVPKHSAHHAHPNEPGRDPDVGEGPAPPSPDGPGKGPGPIASWLARWQAPLFFPLMLLRSSGMHVLGIQRLARRRDRAAMIEASLIVLHAALYLTVVLWVLSPLKALAFVAVQQGVFSVYLGISFAPNHKGMPLIESATAAGFARRQVVTARNIKGGPLTTFMLGGLNYQIEHHLFPSMPRPNLRRVQGLVREFCSAAGLSYSEESFVESFRQITRHLSDAGAAAGLSADSSAPPARVCAEHRERIGERRLPFHSRLSSGLFTRGPGDAYYTGVAPDPGSRSARYAQGTVIGLGVFAYTGSVGRTSLLLAAARRTSRRGHEARRGLRQSRGEMAAASRDRDDLLDHRGADRAATGMNGHSAGSGPANDIPGSTSTPAG